MCVYVCIYIYIYIYTNYTGRPACREEPSMRASPSSPMRRTCLRGRPYRDGTSMGDHGKAVIGDLWGEVQVYSLPQAHAGACNSAHYKGALGTLSRQTCVS